MGEWGDPSWDVGKIREIRFTSWKAALKLLIAQIAKLAYNHFLCRDEPRDYLCKWRLHDQDKVEMWDHWNHISTEIQLQYGRLRNEHSPKAVDGHHPLTPTLANWFHLFNFTWSKWEHRIKCQLYNLTFLFWLRVGDGQFIVFVYVKIIKMLFCCELVTKLSSCQRIQIVD